MNLFEAHELLLNKDSTSVEEVVCWHFLQFFKSVPSSPAVTLNPDSLAGPACECKEEDYTEPK